VSVADHIVTSATVSARLKERRSADSWTVEIRWTASCSGASPGTAWFGGELYLIDADTGERTYTGGGVSTSGESVISGTRHGDQRLRRGPGRDVVQARNGKRELVRCGSGRDRARVDRRDRVRACERVSRPG
jgi:hypothetical protein